MQSRRKKLDLLKKRWLIYRKNYKMIDYNIQITEPAKKDLYDIGTYISKELLNSETAKKLVSKIAKEILALEDMPLTNAIVIDDRLAFKGIRKIQVDNYIVFYITIEASKTVTIIRIIYSKRDWLKLL